MHVYGSLQMHQILDEVLRFRSNQTGEKSVHDAIEVTVAVIKFSCLASTVFGIDDLLNQTSLRTLVHSNSLFPYNLQH